MRDQAPLIAALSNANVLAFAHVVRYCEGTLGEDGYRVMFGGGHLVGLDGVPGTLDDFADHPRTKVTRTMKGKVYTSQAAGAYQWMPPTWDEMAALYGLTDFSPRNQDIGFVGLLIKRKALEDVKAGRFEEAIRKCCWEWASLPGSPYGQPIKTIEVCKREYESAGGVYSPADSQLAITGLDAPQIEVANAPNSVDTAEQPSPTPINENTLNQEQDMAPFIAMALPALFNAVPELMKQFGSGSAVAERNAKAVEIAVNVAKQALGAKNEQEMIEQIQNDPAAAATVRQAVQQNWYAIVETAGGIKGAQEANLKVQGDRNFLFNPAVWVSLLLLVFPMMLCADVFYVHPDEYDGNLRTQIVTAILAVIMMVGAYWLGTTANSKQKDDTMAKMAGGA